MDELEQQRAQIEEQKNALEAKLVEEQKAKEELQAAMEKADAEARAAIDNAQTEAKQAIETAQKETRKTAVLLEVRTLSLRDLFLKKKRSRAVFAVRRNLPLASTEDNIIKILISAEIGRAHV